MTTDIDNLIIENQGLIYKVIKDMSCVYKTEDEFQALYDAGLDGLISGAKTYDKNKEKPSTYLYTCIKNEIKKYFYTSTRKKRINENGKDISLEKIIYGDSKEIELIDTIPDPNVNIEEALEKKLEIERLNYAIDKLGNDKDKLFLCEFYGLKGHKRLLAKEIEKKYNVSHTTVSSRLKRARKLLKKYLENNDKEVFMIEEKKETKTGHTVKATNMKKLNDYLFNQLEILSKVDADLEREIPRAKVMTQLSQQIINNANTCLKAIRTIKEFEINDKDELSYLGFSDGTK